RIAQHEDECRRLHTETQQRAERVQWLTEEIDGLQQAEQEQLKLVEATESRLLSQLEARHFAEAEAQRHAEQEQQLNNEIDRLKQDEQIQLARVAGAQARVERLRESQQAARTELQAHV